MIFEEDVSFDLDLEDEFIKIIHADVMGNRTNRRLNKQLDFQLKYEENRRTGDR